MPQAKEKEGEEQGECRCSWWCIWCWHGRMEEVCSAKGSGGVVASHMSSWANNVAGPQKGGLGTCEVAQGGMGVSMKALDDMKA